MKDGKHHILCIDDDSSVIDWLRIVLEGAGYAVTAAQSAEEGLRLYKESRPDLVIVDLMMEEVDAGASLVKDRKLLGSSTAPIYMLSSVGDELTDTTNYDQLGLDGIFQKPINSELLLRVLSGKLRRAEPAKA